MLKKVLKLVLLGSFLACGTCKADEWIVPYRLAYFTDALQTYNIQTRQDGYHENNWIYKDMSSVEASLSVIAVNYGIERAITGIKDRKWRSAIGWLATSIEAGFVLHNFAIGVKIRF